MNIICTPTAISAAAFVLIACGSANPCDLTAATAMPGTNFVVDGAGAAATLRLCGP